MAQILMWTVPAMAAYMVYAILEQVVFCRFRKTRASNLALVVTGTSTALMLQYMACLYAKPLAALPTWLLLAVFLRLSFRPQTSQPMRTKWWATGGSLAMATIWLWILSVEYNHTPTEGVNLAFPLRHGDRVIFKGGYPVAFNHHRTVKEQAWALDIARPLGLSEMKGLVTKKSAPFAVFGEEVHAPCSGVVTAATRSAPDKPPGEFNLDDAPTGNYVAIRCESTELPVTARLAHLQLGSTRVVEGDRVDVGQVVGLVGNSGHTTMPHLHIDAQDTDGNGVPILFDGRFYRAYDIYAGRVLAPSRPAHEG